MTTILNLVAAIWSVLGVLVIAVVDYRKKLPELN